MPMYDWTCPHGHKFEANVKMAERNDKIPCEGVVNQLCDAGDAGAVETELPPAEGKTEKVWTRPVPCMLKAVRVDEGIGHARPEMLLDYGLGRNRDLANEGRYTGVPSTRGVRKSQI
jgi:hypothetical protein